MSYFEVEISRLGAGKQLGGSHVFGVTNVRGDDNGPEQVDVKWMQHH